MFDIGWLDKHICYFFKCGEILNFIFVFSVLIIFIVQCSEIVDFAPRQRAYFACRISLKEETWSLPTWKYKDNGFVKSHGIDVDMQILNLLDVDINDERFRATLFICFSGVWDQYVGVRIIEYGVGVRGYLGGDKRDWEDALQQRWESKFRTIYSGNRIKWKKAKKRN